MSATTTLIVVRHGETEYNRVGRLQGHRDSPLTGSGREQAARLAERLETAGIGTLYSSDLGRAVATAEAIAEAADLEVCQDPRLRERSYGVFEGLTWSEIEAKYPDAFHGYRTDPEYQVPSGESLSQLYNRTVEVASEIEQRHRGERVAIVTHGGLLACLFRFVLNQGLTEPRRVLLPNAAINVFEVESGSWMVRTLGDTSHLDLASLALASLALAEA